MTRYMSGGQLSGQLRILPAVICVMTCGRGGGSKVRVMCARYGNGGRKRMKYMARDGEEVGLRLKSDGRRVGRKGELVIILFHAVRIAAPACHYRRGGEAEILA